MGRGGTGRDVTVWYGMIKRGVAGLNGMGCYRVELCGVGLDVVRWDGAGLDFGFTSHLKKLDHFFRKDI